jgi:antitoxin Phd
MTSLTSLEIPDMGARYQWAVQDAKSHFSEVMKKAESEGPQTIAVRGKPAVVMISQAEYLKLIAPEKSLFDLLRKSPLAGMDVEFDRDHSLSRDIEL